MPQSFSIDAGTDKSSSAASQNRPSLLSYFSNIITSARQSATEEFEWLCDALGINREIDQSTQLSQHSRQITNEPIFGRVLPDRHRRSVVRDVSIQTEEPSSPIIPKRFEAYSTLLEQTPIKAKTAHESFSVHSSTNQTYGQSPIESNIRSPPPTKRRLSFALEDHHKKVKNNVQKSGESSSALPERISTSDSISLSTTKKSIDDPLSLSTEDQDKKQKAINLTRKSTIPSNEVNMTPSSPSVKRLAQELEEAISRSYERTSTQQNRETIIVSPMKNMNHLVEDGSSPKNVEQQKRKASLTDAELDLRVDALEKKVRYVKERVMEFSNSFAEEAITSPIPSSSVNPVDNKRTSFSKVLTSRKQDVSTPSIPSTHSPTQHSPILTRRQSMPLSPIRNQSYKPSSFYSNEQQQQQSHSNSLSHWQNLSRTTIDSHKSKMRNIIPLIPHVKLRKTDTIIGPDGTQRPNPFWNEIYNRKRRAL
ncbi:MAG: hypothetical protein EXX96DRAFT_555168 [Benjaminiella poitrasii]|nr:MAG: hypothetical protein EXX96DRAFT_555168 [Benjaminiella poitrasii]